MESQGRKNAIEGLVQTIIDEPDNDNAYLVLQDLMVEQGDPRGLLMALMRQGEDWRSYLKSCRATLYGPLGAVDCHELDSPRDAISQRHQVAAYWSRGFVRSLRVTSGNDSLLEPLRRFLNHPSCWVIELLVYDGHSWEFYPLPSLRELHIESRIAPKLSYQRSGNWSMLKSCTPGLKRVSIRGMIGALALPSDVHWIHLRDAIVTPDILSAIAGLPLTELSLRNCDLMMDVVDLIEALSNRESLRVLNLAGTGLKDSDVSGLVGQRALLRRLDVIDLSSNYLYHSVEDLYTTFGSHIRLDNQQAER